MTLRGENLWRIARASAPTIVGILGVFLLSSPLRLFQDSLPTPIFPLLVVYFWSLYSPAHLPAASVFAIGLIQDLLSGGPLGLWPSVYLLVQYLAISQQAYFLGREWSVVWLGFTVASLVSAAIVWLIMSLLSSALLPVGGLLAQIIVTIACFPFFAAAFGNIHRRVVIEV